MIRLVVAASLCAMAAAAPAAHGGTMCPLGQYATADGCVCPAGTHPADTGGCATDDLAACPAGEYDTPDGCVCPAGTHMAADGSCPTDTPPAALPTSGVAAAHVTIRHKHKQAKHRVRRRLGL